MKKSVAILLVLLSSLSFPAIKGYTQENQGKDSVKITAVATNEPVIKKVRKNTISFNITNPSLISSRFMTVGFERVLTPNQTFSVQVGSFSVPKFTGSLADSLGLDTDFKDKGIHLSADYRFYLKKENKYGAPRGVYIGPYYAYNYLNRENVWNLDGQTFNGEVSTNIKLGIHSLGVELGYQFILWDRMSIDLILAGPGMGFYSLKTDLKTTLSPDQESEFFEKLNDYLEQNLPGYDFVIEPGEFKRTGDFNTVDIAYRYSIRIGYRF